ncbi:MAG: CAP domain-containing protein [Kovacikia sp.]
MIFLNKKKPLKWLFPIAIFACLVQGSSRGVAYADACADPSREAIQAYNYLNRFRAEPQSYGNKLGVYLPGRPVPSLHWNQSLSSIARRVAERMAQGNYLSHDDPNGLGVNQQIIRAGYALPEDYAEDPTDNSLESLAAGAPTGIEAINQLIEDEGVSPPSHRVHLLAMDPFYLEHSEVGIGVACANQSAYKYYYVVLTAPKELP